MDNILITGGTGFIGRHLIKHLRNHAEITVLSRNTTLAYHLLGHDIHAIDTLPQQSEFNRFSAIINLAGAPIDKRWTRRHKKSICESRWQLTEQLAQAIKNSPRSPTFISGSAIGYYGDQGDTWLDEGFQCEQSAEFAHSVCRQWEHLANAVAAHSRVCVVRTGIVLSPQHGALKKLIVPFRFGIGGPIASGKQYMSWIHIEDMVRLLLFLLDNDSAYGTFNATAPNPVTNDEFSQQLAKSLHRPYLVRTPERALRLMLGEMANLLTQGQRVYPKQLINAGFKFHYPQLAPALEQLLHKKHN